MTEPRKEDVERALLGAARTEAPSPRARAAALAAATAAMTVAAGTGAVAAGATGKAATGFFAAWKPMLVGALFGGLVVGVIVDYAHRSRAGLGEVPNVTATPSTPKTPAHDLRTKDEALVQQGNASPSVSVNDLPVVPAPERPLPVSPGAKASAAPAPSASSAASAPPPPANVSSSLRDEVRLLDRAREAIVRRDASAALDVLDEYDRTFASPTLKPEAQVLRVEALLAKGDREGALLVARSLTTSHPSGPHRDRLRRLLGSEAP